MKYPKRLTPKWVEKLSPEEVYLAWNTNVYPFDTARVLNSDGYSEACRCLTQHFYQCTAHLQLTAEIRLLMPTGYDLRDDAVAYEGLHKGGMDKKEFSLFLKEHFNELLALRRKYARLYRTPKPKAVV